MLKGIKKLASPFLYASILYVSFAFFVIVFYSFFKSAYSINKLLALLPVIIGFGFGNLILWEINEFLIKFENLKKILITDHLRQCLLPYIIIAIFLLNEVPIFDGLPKQDADGIDYLADLFIFIIVTISTWAIIFNAIFLLFFKNKNSSQYSVNL